MEAGNEMRGNYEAKERVYFEQSRPEMLRLIPFSCQRVLDVGCGSGGFGALLKESRNIEVWGVEPFPFAAAQASVKLDRVLNGTFIPRPELTDKAFDCVVFNDVLEHLQNPDAAIRYARKLLSPNGVIVASIPNIRHLPTIARLLVLGEWKYRDCGTLDKTHLRFFTRSSIREMFQAEGFLLETIEGIFPYRGVPNVRNFIWRLFNIMNLVCFGNFKDLKFERFALIARPANKS